MGGQLKSEKCLLTFCLLVVSRTVNLLIASPVVIVIPASEQQCCKEPSKSPGSLQFKNVILSAIVVLTTCVHSSLQMSVDTKLHTSRQIAFGGSKCDEFPHGG